MQNRKTRWSSTTGMIFANAILWCALASLALLPTAAGAKGNPRVNDLDSRVTTLEFDVDVLAAQDRLLEAQIDALAALPHGDHVAELAAISIRLDDLETLSAIQATALAALEGRVAALEGAPPPPPPPIPVCGNGILEIGGEECDDGNLLDGDGCSSTCVLETLPPPPPPPPGVYDLLATHLPPPGEFALLPGTQIDVLTGASEFPFCASIRCFASYNSFVAWVGMAFDEANGLWWNLGGGGHQDYGGNEIYRFSFDSFAWERVTEPQPLTVPNGNCPNPATGPPSKHTYDGAVYIAEHNEILVLASGGFCMGQNSYGASSSWAWELGSSTWRELTHLSGLGFGRADYDAVRGRVYMVGGVDKNTFFEFDAANDYQIVSQVNINSSNDGVAQFDPVTRYLYYTNGASDSTGGLKRIHIATDGTRGTKETVLSWSQTGGQSFRSFAIHTPSGKLVLWRGNEKVYRVDPDTGAVEDLSSAGPNTGNDRVYSKWVYISAVDAFVGFHDPRSGIWAYRLPEAVPVASNFEERCTAAGVVFCDPLDTEGPYDGTGRVMLNPDGTQGLPTETWWRKWRGSANDCGPAPGLDTGVKASGTGSLKVTYESETSEACSGNFVTNFSDDLSQTFGEGDTFYVQYRWRANCDFVYFDCDPSSPTYKATRRFFETTDGGAGEAKLSIIADGDPALDESADACTWLQIVVDHKEDHFLHGFHSCGWYESFKKATGEVFGGSSQFDFQPNGAAQCWWMPDPAQPDNKKAWGFTGPNCWRLDSDEWATVQVMIRIGTWQPDRGSRNSHVTIWAAHEGESQRVVTDRDIYIRGPRADPNGEYGKIWLHAFVSHKDPTEVHPTAHVWFDELIVSTEFIEDAA